MTEREGEREREREREGGYKEDKRGHSVQRAREQLL